MRLVRIVTKRGLSVLKLGELAVRPSSSRERGDLPIIRITLSDIYLKTQCKLHYFVAVEVEFCGCTRHCKSSLIPSLFSPQTRPHVNLRK